MSEIFLLECLNHPPICFQPLILPLNILKLQSIRKFLISNLMMSRQTSKNEKVLFEMRQSGKNLIVFEIANDLLYCDDISKASQLKFRVVRCPLILHSNQTIVRIIINFASSLVIFDDFSEKCRFEVVFTIREIVILEYFELLSFDCFLFVFVKTIA